MDAEPRDEPAPTADGEEVSGPAPRNRVVDISTLAALIVVAVPLITALVAVSSPHWYPTGDMAQAELHMRGFFSHPPLVGAAGRIGTILLPYGQGSHPGPAMWFAMLPVYLVLGRSAYGLMVAVTVVQLAFILLTVSLVRRVGGPLAGLVVAVMSAVLVHSLGSAVFIEPWNPWLGLFAFSACIAAAWGVLCGHHRWLWLAVGTGTFAVQCHAGYIPLVGALLAALVAVVLVRWRRDRSAGVGRSWWFAVGVFVIMWVPPVVDQLQRTPGNLRILFHHFTATTDLDGSPRHYVGIVGAVKAFAGEFSVSGPWVRGQFRQPFEPPNWAAFLLAVALVGGGLTWALRTMDSGRRRPLLILTQLLGGLTVVGIVASARIFGEFYSYVVRWWSILVAWSFALMVLAVLTASADLRRARHEGAMPESDRRLGAALLVTCAIVAGAVATANAADATIPAERNSGLVGGVTPLLEHHLDRSSHYLVRWYDPATLGGVPFGVFLELDRDGYHVGVDAMSSAAALPHRVLEVAHADAVLWVVAGDNVIESFRGNPKATELAFYDGRSPQEKQRSDEVRAQLEQRLEEVGQACLIPTLDSQYGLAPLVIGGVDVPADIRGLASEYDTIGLPVAVFSVPTSEPWYETGNAGCD